MRSTMFNFLPQDPVTSSHQVPDDEADFDWISVSETPC